VSRDGTKDVEAMTGPLADIRVLDLAGESGLFAGRQFAELGADVIRIEPPGGDASRRRRPFLGDRPGLERSLYHLHFNAGKRGLVLDLDGGADQERLRALAASADVLIETARPGSMDAHDIGYAALAERNPSLIYTTITPFGQEGPLRDYRGNDLIGAATSGLLYLNGFDVDPPNLPGAEQAYHMASLVATAGSLIALTGRGRDPGARGRRVDVSIQEATSMATLQTANANYFTWHDQIVRRVPLPSGDGSGAATLVRSQDGKWLNFTVPIGAPHLWNAFVDWLREEDVIAEEAAVAWRDPDFRFEHVEAVAGAVAELAGHFPREWLFHEGQRRRMLVMPLNTPEDLLADSQMRARGIFVPQAHPEASAPLLDVGTAYHLSASPASLPRRAPLLNEHADEVLRELASPRPRVARTQVARSGGGGPAAKSLPLAGIRVLDFCWMIAGPAGSRMLADFGAEVIKVESQYRLDNIRALGIQPPDPSNTDSNGVFNDVGTNKRSITLNLNTPRGIELAQELVAQSDIVTNNFTGDRMDRWGLGYEDLRKLKDDIILLTMPVMGTTGPTRRYGSYGNGVIAFGGLTMNMGLPERPPIGMAPLYSDFSAPYFLVSALMAALHHRDRTGEGQFIDLAQAEATVSLLGTDILDYTANGRVAERSGNRVADYCPHGAFGCAGEDRWCAIAVGGEAEWRKLCAVMGRPEAVDDPRFASHEARKQNEDAVEALVGAWTGERDAWDVMHTLQGAGLMAGVVEDLEDMVTRDPWLPGHHLVPVTREGEGTVFTTHAQPLRLDGETPPLRRAPLFGEANEYVFKDLLGVSEAEFVELLVEKVVY